MATKFGGKYSPGQDGTDPQGGRPPASPFEGKTVTRAGGRINALFLLPFPFIISAFRSDPVGLSLNLACFGCLMLSAWLTREGVLAEEAYAARRVARRPAIPRKIFGSALMGLGLALAGLADGQIVNAVIFAVLGAGLHTLAFGIDPLKSKGIEGADRMQTDRVARAVSGGEGHLKSMTEAIVRTRDRALETRVDLFQTTARKMFRAIEEDPRDLTAARKFLGVYLQGARDATVKFADLYSRTRDSKARQDYLALLDDLDKNFAAKTETLLLDNRADLDIEIEVLRERLQRETL